MEDRRRHEGMIKHKLRRLRKLEIKIRFGQRAFMKGEGWLYAQMNATALVWDEMFDLHTRPTKKSKYSFNELIVMSGSEIDDVVNEFFFKVNYRFYKENGIVSADLYDPNILSQLGLPYDADVTAVKKRFRELVKKHHPDAGGDHVEFISLMDSFRQLVD